MSLGDWITLETLPGILSALTMAAVGLWLIVIQPRNPAALGFAAYLIGRAGIMYFGSHFFLLTPEPVLAMASISFAIHLAALAVAGAVALLLSFPRPLGRYWALSGALLAFLAIEALATTGPQVVPGQEAAGLFIPTASGTYTLPWVHVLNVAVISSSMLLAAVAFRAQFFPGKGDHHAARLVILALLATTTHDALRNMAGAASIAASGAAPSWVIALFVTTGTIMSVTVMAAAVPFLQAERSQGAWRAKTVFIALAGGVGLAAGAGWGTSRGLDWADVLTGILRIHLPLLVGYALARHRLFRQEKQVRFTVRSGTLAAMFIALFFLVSELAAEFFQDKTGSSVLGLASAAGVVFFLSPVQRFADRVARSTVGSSGDTAFEEVVRMAWADGSLTASERLQLDEARQRLGVSTEVATEIERRVMREQTG